MRRLLLSAALMFLASGCSDDCSNRIVARSTDPASDWIAYVFTRDCGATTDFVTNVAIGRRGEDPAEAQVVFSADADHGSAVQEQGGAIWLRAVWTAPAQLSVTFAEHSRVFRAQGAARGVKVGYRASGPVVLPPVP